VDRSALRPDADSVIRASDRMHGIPSVSSGAAKDPLAHPVVRQAEHRQRFLDAAHEPKITLLQCANSDSAVLELARAGMGSA
jgi:hypothetical protein